MEPYDEATFDARARQLVPTPDGKPPFASLNMQRNLTRVLAQGRCVIALQKKHHHL